jgi:hypothetical protein
LSNPHLDFAADDYFASHNEGTKLEAGRQPARKAERFLRRGRDGLLMGTAAGGGL